ncbi:MAG: PKD domain-containing protein [Chloroflexaceae bacterium]|nr:PKD domain-containing protein [Chloroflexaceae bacterium]
MWLRLIASLALLLLAACGQTEGGLQSGDPLPAATPVPTATPAPPGLPAPTAYPTPSPAAMPGDFTLTLVAEAQVGASRTITFTATLTGGPDNSKEFYCRGIAWNFGDGKNLTAMPGCPPWSPDMRIARTFSISHTYEGPGTITVELQVGPLTANPLTVEVR